MQGLISYPALKHALYNGIGQPGSQSIFGSPQYICLHMLRDHHVRTVLGDQVLSWSKEYRPLFDHGLDDCLDVEHPQQWNWPFISYCGVYHLDFRVIHPCMIYSGVSP